MAKGKEIHRLYGPHDRYVEFPSAAWDFLIHVAKNSAAAFETLHEHGVIMADVNEKNLLVTSSGYVRLIDCDSYQFSHSSSVFHCDVGVPLWTPPELQGRDFRGLVRTKNHDRFGLAVLMFQLLFMGRHPFAGVPDRPEQFEIENAIGQFLFVFTPRTRSLGISSPPHALPLSVLPDNLTQLFERAFLRGSERDSARPSGREWFQALDFLSNNLRGCSRDPGHKYPSHLAKCPWCGIYDAGGPNFFISVVVHVSPQFADANVGAYWAAIQQVSPRPLVSKDLTSFTLQKVTGTPLPTGMSKTRPGFYVGWFIIAASVALFWVVGCFAGIGILIGWGLVAEGSRSSEYSGEASRRRQAAEQVKAEIQKCLNDASGIVAAYKQHFKIQFPGDAFLSPLMNSEDMRWVKFAIVLDEPTRVYFQNSTRHPFHYDFAVQRLEPFVGLTRGAFDAVSLRSSGQRIVLGAVLFPPASVLSEYGIQFVGLDPYPKESVAPWFALVKSAVAGRSDLEALYLPTFEQSRVAETDRAFYESQGIKLSSVNRWLPGDQTYSQGWALGRLKYFPASDIAQAFAEGRLMPQDILLTDGVPAEIPVLAGIISLTPSTPNSHVVILARSLGIPFAYLSSESNRAWVRQCVDREVVFKAGRTEWDGRVELFALNPDIAPELKNEILAMKEPVPIRIPRKETSGAFAASADRLAPADIKYFGGKAANFGLLRQGIPSNSPVAIAFSFDLWDAFLDQALPTGMTLRSEIRERLTGYTYPPPMPSLSATLAGIRELITDTARFSPELRQVVISALQTFDPDLRIRFRSSTNVEDSEQFSGAGLYDSFSGCLADDLDGDSSGPSRCDPTESKERGVFRAIQKVYASFYNDNAFFERLRHKISENDAGMGLLVHHSAPDTLEMANGVAALRVLIGPGSTNFTAELVTQLGAASVSNPDTSARPEVVRTERFSAQTYFTRKQSSALVPLGASVMDWEKDYQELMTMLYAATDRFRDYFLAKTQFTLDFEYKKLQPGVLSVKQIRQIPEMPAASDPAHFFLDHTNSFTVLQSEFSDAFSIHRLKSELTLHTRDLRLLESNLNASLYRHARITRVEDSDIHVMEGILPGFSQAAFSRTNRILTDRWTAGSGLNHRQYSLITELPEPSQESERALVTLQDCTVRLRVEFQAPLPKLDPEGNPATTTVHEVLLQPVFPSDSLGAPVERMVRGENGLEVRTRFFWYRQRGGGIELKTAPLLRWDETRILGLISRPILLKGYYSQTYHPFHHNFIEEFIYEPRLEDGLAASDLAELRAANIQLIYVHTGEGQDMILALGYDGKFRSLAGETPKASDAVAPPTE
ncbi:MAG: hypothetical protein O2960_24710 [Verrucomicrobia bacterium]|nr:hypothetical protein [Verrucomicrobiota bacterium]